MTESALTEWTWKVADESGTEQLGRALAGCLPDGIVVALQGPLGAGKTRLVQALAVACGVARQAVVSPTFILCQEYQGQRTLYHFDAYRLRDADEFEQLGVEEYFSAGGLVLIEWAERVAEILPADHLEIRIEVLSGEQRQFRFRAAGPRSALALQRLPEELPPA